MHPYTLIGLLLSLVGCIALYLSSPHQRWMPRPAPRLPARLGGAALLMLGWFSLSQALQLLTTAFVFLTFLMLVLALLPYTGALLRQNKES